MNLFSRLFRRNQRSNTRQININSGNYNERIGRDYIQGNVYYGETREERKTLPQRDKTQQTLLDYVKHEVASRLKQSLHQRVSILLDKEEAPNQVNPSWAIDVKIGSHQSFPLPTETTIIDIYDREDINGRLLILGAPGSGKTTTLLQLAQVLANRASEDIEQPIPVLLNLSSWKDDNQSIKNWIIANLKLVYGVRKDIGKNWLESAIILPLLDGLDELASDRQEKCVQQINHFLNSERWLNSLVVCSRTEEYQNYQTKLSLSGSIILQPLSQEQIQDFILRTEGQQLWSNIKEDSNLMELAKTPLLLNIIVISCEEISFDNWQKLESSKQRLSYLFDAYITRMLRREYRGKKPTDEKTKQWLGCLSEKLIWKKETEFFIEKLDPSYYLHYLKKEKLIYKLIVGLIVGLIAGLITGLIVGLITGLIVGLIAELIYWTEINEMADESIERIETLNFSSFNLINLINLMIENDFTEVLYPGLFYGLSAGLIAGLIVGRIVGLIAGLIAGLIVVLNVELILIITMIMLSVIEPLFKIEINIKKYPNQGIIESFKNGVLISIFFSTVTIIVFILIQKMLENFNLSELKYLLDLFLAVGITIAILLSSFSVIQHFSLRIVLWSKGYAPWNYARFLNYCTDRLFLQRVGGGYRFIHRLLQEHFARMWLEKQSVQRRN